MNKYCCGLIGGTQSCQEDGPASEKNRTLRRGRNGFTLIEILATVVVLGIGSLAVISLMAASMKGNETASTNSMSSFLAESRIEWLRSLDFNEIPFESGTAEKLSVQGENCEPDCIHDSPPCQAPVCYYTRTTTVTSGYPTSLSHEVSVKVEWTSDRDHELIYDTVISSMNF